MAHRHDGVRNLLTSLIGKVCTNVEVQPQLQPLAIQPPKRGKRPGGRTGLQGRGLLVSWSYSIF